MATVSRGLIVRQGIINPTYTLASDEYGIVSVYAGGNIEINSVTFAAGSGSVFYLCPGSTITNLGGTGVMLTVLGNSS